MAANRRPAVTAAWESIRRDATEMERLLAKALDAEESPALAPGTPPMVSGDVTAFGVLKSRIEATLTALDVHRAALD